MLYLLQCLPLFWHRRVDMSSIKTGFWINWEHGAIVGSTLTLPTVYGLILVSFLTLFVQFSGGCLWRALCFILHQSRSTTAARDGLFHQQQIILRNAITAPNALWGLGRSAVLWKSRAAAPFSRSLPLLFVAVLHIACFAAAGLLSSQIASTEAGQALVDSKACGYPRKLATLRTASSKDLSDVDLNIFNAQVLQGRFTVSKSTAYVSSCYNNNNSASGDCNHFVKRNLMGEKSSADMQASCPFGADTCLTKAVRYDSGLLSSNNDVGINLPPTSSVMFRRVTTCAPIQVNKYATGWVDNLPESYGSKANTSVKFFEFGKGDTGCTATRQNQTTAKTTFCISQWMKDYLPGAYHVTANTAYAENADASDFEPIPDFQVADADVILISIFNKAVYKGKVSDPLFEAHVPVEGNSQFYAPTNELAVLGCTEQYQFCQPMTQKCTNLSGLYAVLNAVNRGDIGLTGRQRSTFSVVWEAAWGMSMQWTIRLINERVLLAQNWAFTVIASGSSALPPNQWQQESSNLHNLSLAVFQHRINQYASPENFELSPGVRADANLDSPTDPNLLQLCKSQRVLSPRHYSVSVLGMAIILSVGTLLIILDQSVESIWFRYFNPRCGLAKMAEWTQTGTMQLHRQTVEARGIGPWDRKNHDFPVIGSKGMTFIGLGAREEMIGQTKDDNKTQYELMEEEISLDERSAQSKKF
ncbi:hypothetical protein HBI23_104690 [Parastagonospora nodorum]|nr:hypothetical protein HBI29_043550 [Parastagonospora nodorum]KAH5662263.1 hypothetical protein HBI23_104690 [Parastagonospora nodorum]